MYAKKTDGSQAEQVRAARAVGAFVVSLHKYGEGVPDLLVGYRGQWHLIECKSKYGKRTIPQIAWADCAEKHGCPVHICKTADELLKAIGAVRK